MQLVRRGLLLVVLGALSGVALATGVAGGQQSTQPVSTASVAPWSVWGEALVDGSAGRLVGGGGLVAARAARRASPEAVAARAASREEFHGLSFGRLRAVTAGSFPQLLAPSDGVPVLPAGDRIVGYPTAHSAELSTPRGPRLIEAVSPIATSAGRGHRVPLNLGLTEAGASFRPVRSSVAVSFPRDISRGVALANAGVSLTPITRSGGPLTSASGVVDGASVLWDAMKPANSGEGDLATLAKASPDGFELTSVLLSQQSPGALYFRIGMPAGASITQTRGGAIRVLDRGAIRAVVEPVSAEDAEGTSVPVSESLHGHTIELSVSLGGGLSLSDCCGP